jgi:hypothetical protein
MSQDIPSIPQKELAKHMIRRFCRYMRERPLTQELLRWEMVESNELTRVLADFRETEGLKILERFERDRGTDLYALTAVVVAGIMYLVLCKKHIRYFNGIDLQTDSGWERIEEAAAWIVESSINTERSTNHDQ